MSRSNIPATTVQIGGPRWRRLLRRLPARALLAGALVSGGSTFLAAAPAAASTVKPSISKFTASKSSLSSTGGSITLTGTVTKAATCTFTSSPTVSGLKSESCTKGTATDTVKLPSNSTSATVTYTFTLKATSTTKTSVSKSLKVTVLPPKPTVTAVTASPSSLPASGGSTTVKVTATHAATCKLSVSPAVTGSGLPKSLTCSKGSASVTVTLPANTATSSATYKFSATATNSAGTSASKSALATVAGVPAPPTVDDFIGTPDSLPAAGGTTTLSATVSKATSCQFAEVSGPTTVSGLSSAVTCSSGTVDSPELSLPANTTYSTVTYTFSLVVTGPGGKVQATPDATVNLAAASPPPTATNFAAAPDSLPSTGGTTTLSATVSNGSTCQFAEVSGPTSLSGLSSAVTCSSGTVDSAELTIPANESELTETYTFSLEVTGPGGDVEAAPDATVNVAAPAGPPAPTATDFTAAPDSLASAGGTTTLSATVSNATSCQFAEVTGPSEVTGLSSPVTCSSGTVDSAELTLPANTTGAIETYTFSLTVTGSGGEIEAMPNATVTVAASATGSATPLTFAAGAQIEPPVSNFDYVSCPTATFCAAAGGSAPALAVVYSSGSWGTPSALDPTGEVQGLSCSSSTFCVAWGSTSSNATELFVYNGTSWTAETTLPAELTSSFGLSGVSEGSCVAGTAFCMLVSYAGYVVTTKNGTTFTSQASIYSNGLTCLSSTSCLSVTDNTLYTWNGTAWTSGASLPEGDEASGFACASTTVCAAIVVNQETFAFTLYGYNGTAWTASSDTISTAFSSFGCTPGGSCELLAADASFSAELLTYTGTAWTTSTATPGYEGFGQTSDLSCPTSSSCTYVVYAQAYSYNGTSWTSGTSIGWAGSVAAISCASSTYCVAVDNAGNATTYNGTTWSTPTSVLSDGLGFSALSCFTDAGVNDCEAVDSAGDVYLDTGGTWTLPSSGEGAVIGANDSIDCLSLAFCVAVGGETATIWSGGTWTASVIDPTNLDLSSVSCTSTTRCVAVDDSGTAFVYDGSTWSAGTVVDPSIATTFGAVEVSCLSASLCVAASSDGNVETFDGSGWSSPSALDGGNSVTALSCIPASGYCVAAAESPTADDLWYLVDTGTSVGWSEQAGALSGEGGIEQLSCAPGLCVGDNYSNGGFYGTPVVAAVLRPAATAHTTVSPRTSAAPLSFSQGTAIEPPISSYSWVSCPTATFCAAVGGSNPATAVVYSSGSWGTPTTLATNGNVEEVSCSSASLCLATGSGPTGDVVYSYLEGTWALATSVPTYETAGAYSALGLSCVAGAGFCMLSSPTGAVVTTTDGSTFTPQPSLQMNALSCSSSTSCSAVVGDTAYTWNGTTWTSGPSFSVADEVLSLGCASASSCAVALQNTTTYVDLLASDNGTKWTTSSKSFTEDDSQVTCVAGGDCYVIGTNSSFTAYLYTDASGTWSTSTSTPPDLSPESGFSCASATFCSYVSGAQGVIYNGSSWSTPTSLGWGAQVFDVSCATATFCVAVDNEGNATVYDGSTWSTPAAVGTGGNSLISVSCFVEDAADECEALDAGGNVYLYSGGTWSLPSSGSGALSGGGFQASIDCLSTSFCAAVSGEEAGIYTGGSSWSSSAIDSTDVNLASVSCPSTSLCVAVDSSGEAFTYNGSGWSAGTSIDPSQASEGYTETVSCLSATFCLAGGNDGNVEVFNGTSWSTASPLDGGNNIDTISCSAAAGYCVVVAGSIFNGGQDLFYATDVDGAPSWVEQSAALTTGQGVNELSCTLDLCVGASLANEGYYGTPST